MSTGTSGTGNSHPHPNNNEDPSTNNPGTSNTAGSASDTTDVDHITTRFVFNTNNHQVTAETDNRRTFTPNTNRPYRRNYGSARRVYSSGSRSYPTGNNNRNRQPTRASSTYNTNSRQTYDTSSRRGIPLDGFRMGGGQNARTQFGQLGSVTTLHNSGVSNTNNQGHGIMSNDPVSPTRNYVH